MAPVTPWPPGPFLTPRICTFPDRNLWISKASKQIEGIDPAASTEAIASAEADDDAAVPAAADGPVDAAAPPQIDPIVTEAVTLHADDSGAPASGPPQE